MNIITKIKNKLKPKKPAEEIIYKTFKCAKCEKQFSETKSGVSKIELQYRTPSALLPTMCFFKLCEECGRKANIAIIDFIYGASVRESDEE